MRIRSKRIDNRARQHQIENNGLNNAIIAILEQAGPLKQISGEDNQQQRNRLNQRRHNIPLILRILFLPKVHLKSIPRRTLISHSPEHSTHRQVLQRADSSTHWRNRDANVRNVLRMFSKRLIEWSAMAKNR